MKGIDKTAIVLLFFWILFFGITYYWYYNEYVSPPEIKEVMDKYNNFKKHSFYLEYSTQGRIRGKELFPSNLRYVRFDDKEIFATENLVVIRDEKNNEFKICNNINGFWNCDPEILHGREVVYVLMRKYREYFTSLFLMVLLDSDRIYDPERYENISGLESWCYKGGEIYLYDGDNDDLLGKVLDLKVCYSKDKGFPTLILATSSTGVGTRTPIRGDYRFYSISVLEIKIEDVIINPSEEKFQGVIGKFLK